MNPPNCFGPAALSFLRRLLYPVFLKSSEMTNCIPIDCIQFAVAEFWNKLIIYMIHNIYTKFLFTFLIRNLFYKTGKMFFFKYAFLILS